MSYSYLAHNKQLLEGRMRILKVMVVLVPDSDSDSDSDPAHPTIVLFNTITRCSSVSLPYLIYLPCKLLVLVPLVYLGSTCGQQFWPRELGRMKGGGR